jgi:glycosyltransferase involved in cell wall biosynthesis
MARPDLSVVIPTYNRSDRIRRVLDALLVQDFPRSAYEIIVVSDGSTDGTNAYLTNLSYPIALQPVFQPNLGPAAARNVGISRAKGQFIVFIDDDVVPAHTLLSEHMRSHAEAGRDVAVIGPLVTPKECALAPWVNWEQEMLLKQYEAMIRGDWLPSARQFYTGNASVRRDFLLAVGGFDESLRRAEDVELAYRLTKHGLGFVFNEAAEGLHYADRGFQSWLDTAYTYGKNDAIFARDRDQTWLLPKIQEEFYLRKPPLRLLMKACLGRPKLTALAITSMSAVAEVAGKVGVAPAERAAYSGLFGLRYHQGFLDEIGDTEFFARAPVPLTAA